MTTITVRLRPGMGLDPEVTILREIGAHLCIHASCGAMVAGQHVKSRNAYTLTHIPTGRLIASSNDLEKLTSFAKSLLEFDWNFSNPLRAANHPAEPLVWQFAKAGRI